MGRTIGSFKNFCVWVSQMGTTEEKKEHHPKLLPNNPKWLLLVSIAFVLVVNSVVLVAIAVIL